MLNKKYIKQNIKYVNNDVNNIAKSIKLNVLNQITSTNEYLKNFCINNISNIDTKNIIKICIAEEQINGRGRFNKTWHSPNAQNIYLSYTYAFCNPYFDISGLSIIISLAVISTLKILFSSMKLTDELVSNFMVKWPNDIMYDNKKIAGILIDVISDGDVLYAIIGIGLNVNMIEDANIIEKSNIDFSTNSIIQPWSSLKEILQLNQVSKSDIDRNDLCIILINELLLYTNLFEKHGLNKFMNEWENVDILFNKKIKLISNFDNSNDVNKFNNNIIECTAKGINSLGNLVVELPSGKIKTYSYANTTIIKE